MKGWIAAALCCLLFAPAPSGRAEDCLEIYCIDPCGGCMGAEKPCADHCTVEDELYLRYRALPADVEVVRIDVGTQEGMLLERAVHARYDIPEDQYYVPLVIYGEDWLMGRDSIFLSLPSRIEERPDAVTPDAGALLGNGEG